ncbi:MAG: hypothetical protein ACYTGV_01800 [Planctomycetota bacterium]
MTLRERILPLRRGLGRLRRRVRWLLALLGGSRLMVFAVAVLLVFFFADYLLRLPIEVRRILVLCGLVGLLALFVRHLLRPLATRLDDDALAARVEAAYPDLENRLSSSLAFARAADDPENQDSPELMRAVVDETTGMAGSIRFREVAQGHTTMRWAASAGALLLVAALGILARPDLAGLFVERSLLLREVDWPRRTTLVVVGMEPETPRRVTRGRETTIEIRAEGSAPGRISFTFEERETGGSEGRGRETIELTPSAEDRSLFAITLPVYASYVFSVTGGDDQRAQPYRIEALTPPAILEIGMECTYPDYLERAPETLRGGDRRVPEGTKVRMRVKANMALERATITLGGDEPRELEHLEADLFTLDLAPTKDTRYSIRLQGENGEENDPGVDTFILRVQKDHAPIVRVLTPVERSLRTASGVLLFAFSARDDYRVRRARFVYRIRDEEERVVATGESGGDALRLLEPVNRPDEHLRGLAILDLARLRTKGGLALRKDDTVTCRVEATDSAGKVTRSRSDYVVQIVGEEDLSQTIQARQQDLRDAVERAQDYARTAMEDVEAVHDARGNVSEFRTWSARAQAAQARVVTNVETVARQVRGMLNLYVFNRLDDAATVDQMLPYYERHLLEPQERSGAAFRAPLYANLWTAYQERAIRAGGALSKLMEMADLSGRLSSEHGPRAYRALSRLGSAREKERVDELIEEAMAEQEVIHGGLERLDRLMREWLSFEGVVRFFKSLRDREEEIVDKLRGFGQTGK